MVLLTLQLSFEVEFSQDVTKEYLKKLYLVDILDTNVAYDDTNCHNY